MTQQTHESIAFIMQSSINDAGRMVQSVWNELLARFPGSELDAFVVMPNHVRGIILVGALLAAPSPRDRASSWAQQAAPLRR